jgi:hypothetical protein
LRRRSLFIVATRFSLVWLRPLLGLLLLTRRQLKKPELVTGLLDRAVPILTVWWLDVDFKYHRLRRHIEPPLSLEQDYLGEHFTAMVNENGDVVYDGKEYPSPSVAGGMAKIKVRGPRPEGKRPYYSTNGWIFWRYKDPNTGELEELRNLRNPVFSI